MEKVSDLIRALPPKATYFSLEFFPPKTEMGLENLQGRLSRMSQALRPLFVTVTWGAGGSTCGRSLELAEICQRQLGLTTCLHLTCTNTSKQVIDDALRDAKELGIRNILALRGDLPREEEYDLKGADHGQPAFTWAVDLVRYIRKEYGDYFCIGVAGYPEGHADESHPVDQDPKHDMPYLVEKVKAGADFIMTQLFYDVNAYLEYEKLVLEWDNGVLKDMVLIPGLMPIQRYQNLKRIAQLSHAKLPDSIFKRLEPIRGNDEAVKRVGIEVLTEIVQTVKNTPSTRNRGFHFYTLNLEKSVSYILERCALIAPATPENDDDVAVDDSNAAVNAPSINAPFQASAPRRRRSSAHNQLIDDRSSSGTLDPPTRATTLEISRGVGALGREATWDDYPNGRFGDARSPAFGEIDGYGPSLHMSAAQARQKWGAPASRADLAAMFLKHIHGELDQLPWSEGTLSPETRAIEKHLSRLISEKGWLSIASQPAVDGKKSSDSIYGWGPPGGFVFQKAFVEFWIPLEDWKRRLRPHLEQDDVAALVSWYVSGPPKHSPPTPHNTTSNGDGQAGDADTNSHDDYVASSPAADVNSVTWGVFPGKEIVTPTMVETISFRAWADEAFGIWGEWERCYARGSPARAFLRRCQEDYVLVNVIAHQFREEDALWDILFEA